LGIKQCERVLDAEASVGEESFETDREENTPVSIEARLYTNVHISHSWLIRLISEVGNILDNLCMKPSNKISTYNVDFICYAS